MAVEFLKERGRELVGWLDALARQRWMLLLGAIGLFYLLWVGSNIFHSLVHRLATIPALVALAYYADRAVYYYARPHQFLDRMEALRHNPMTEERDFMIQIYADLAATAQTRRAILMAAVILTVLTV